MILFKVNMEEVDMQDEVSKAAVRLQEIQEQIKALEEEQKRLVVIVTNELLASKGGE